MSHAANPLLGRRPHHAVPALSLGDGAALALARLHEGCGAARRSFAMLVAARVLAAGRKGAIWWIAPAWQADQLHAEGVAEFVGPERLILVRPKRAEDVLWTLEEILRSGTAPLAVADIPGLPSLTAVRRLHLAAESGAETGQAPLGLILTPGPGGAQGVESRWRCDPDHGPRTRAWRLERLRARMDPPRRWQLTHEADAGFALHRPPAQATPASA